MSKVKVTRPLWLAVLAGQHGHRVNDGSICVYDVYRVTAWAGAYCGGLPPTACFSLLLCSGSFLRIEKYIYYVWVGGEVIISF